MLLLLLQAIFNFPDGLSTVLHLLDALSSLFTMVLVAVS
jgi:hypothetical protein